MGAGQRRARCQFQARGALDDGYGNPVAGEWSTVLELRGEYVEATGRETVEVGRREESVRATLKIRASAAARALTPANRVLVNGDPHQILAIRDPRQRGRYLVLDLERNAAIS